MGRSWGCFALSRKVENSVVRAIRGSTVLVGYYPDPKWLDSSPSSAPKAKSSGHAWLGRSWPILRIRPDPLAA